MGAPGGWGTRRKNAELARQDLYFKALEEGMRLNADRIAEWLIESRELVDITAGRTDARVRNQLRVQLAGEIRLGAYAVERKGVPKP